MIVEVIFWVKLLIMLWKSCEYDLLIDNLICILESTLNVTSFAMSDNFYIADKSTNYPIKVRGIEIHPNPVVGGKPAQFKILASSGKITYSLLLYFHLFVSPLLWLKPFFYFP